MNCVESQDLLLDLAYGELPPARAVEVEAHVLGCATCRAEMAQLEDARKAAAPLRELEEPPAGFDEPILRAARAEAGLQADGTPGPVVEVSATVKPLGLQAARLDPHARMRGGTARPGPRWGQRAAVFGSIAAAAGLAVVVTSSLRPKHTAQQMAEEVAPIQVRAPATVPISGDDGSLAKYAKAVSPEESSTKRAREPVAPPPARAVDAAKQKMADAPARAKDRTALSEQQAPAAAQKTAPVAQQAPAAAEKTAPVAQQAPAALRKAPAVAQKAPIAAREADGLIPLSGERFRSPEQATERPAREGLVREYRQGPRPDAERSSEESKVTEAASPGAGTPQVAPLSAPAAAPPVGGRFGGAQPGPANPDQLEEQASAARRGGDYARAAALYREASAMRRELEPARAAWDMAHAVECLAAGGQVDQAVAARRELLRAFPGHSGPKAAADSALRSVRLPADEEKPR